MAEETEAGLLKKLNSFPWEDWNTSLGKGMMQPYRDLVIVQAQKAAELSGGTLDPKDPLLQKFMTNYVTARVVQLNDTTKASVHDLITRAFAGGSTDKLGEQILADVRTRFEGYEAWRAERIARTETAIGFNHANTLGFAQAGVEEVEIVDGTEDDICEEANGETWTLREFLEEPLGHPNCVRAGLPKIADAEQRRRAYEQFERLMLDDDLPFICAISAELIACGDDPRSDRLLDAIEDVEEE